jgi:hypothetical protein
MSKEKRSGWWWVPSLYYAEGIPYNIAMIVSVVSGPVFYICPGR